MRTKTLSTLSLASLALFLFACGSGGNTAANNSTATTVNKTTTTTNSGPSVANNTAPAANTSPSATPSGESQEDDNVTGELQVGKTESVILYVGQETGDYAGYCFTNDSEAGRAILAACKDKAQCEVIGKVDHEAGCKVPGLEATLSDSGKIVQVKSAKSLGSKK